MEQLSKEFERLQVDTELSFIFLSEKLIHLQKCYISRKVFLRLNLQVGEIILINCDSCSYLCRTYCKTLLQSSVIEVNGTTQIPHSQKKENILAQHRNRKIPLERITKLGDIVVLKDICIQIVFESFKSFEKWNSRESDFMRILKNYILNRVILFHNCIISLMALPKAQRAGISKIIVSFNSGDRELILSPGRVNTKTNIKLDDKITQYQFDQRNSTAAPLFGLERPLDILNEIIDMNTLYHKMGAGACFPPTKQILIVGPSGCGKSSLVKLIAQTTGCTIVTVHGHEVNQSEPGETESALRNLFGQAFQYANISGKCIIDLEEVDILCPRREGSGGHVQRAITQLLNLLDSAQNIPGVIVIATTNKPEVLDPSIRRHGRLETEIYIGPPTELQRVEILRNLIKKLNLYLVKEDVEKLCDQIASMTPGYVGADLKSLYQAMAWKLQKNDFGECAVGLKFWMNEFRNIILNMTPASLKGTVGVVTRKHTSHSDLAGLDNIKKRLEMAILWPLIHGDAFKRLGIPRPRGVLLYGPPGCAKTSLVRAMAGAGTFSLLSISAAELYSPYVGDAERLIAQLFQRARQNSPCILFIDEIDALAGSRGISDGGSSDVQERVIASLLTQMDGVGHNVATTDSDKEGIDDGVIVIGATNRPDMIDSALLRPGRFDKHIHVPPPDINARIEILKLMTSKMPLENDIVIYEIASKTEFYSGADLKNICMEAALLAMSNEGMDVKEIKYKYFVSALGTTRPSLSVSQINEYSNFELNKMIS